MDQKPKLEVPGGYSIPEPEENEAPQVEPWTTCFIIGIDAAGVAHASENPQTFVEGKAFMRQATINDMAIGTIQVQRDLDHISIAQRVMINMMSAGAAMQEQMAAQQIADQNASAFVKDISDRHAPGKRR